MKFDNGVLIANLMPFNEDLLVNWDALADHTQKLQAIIDGIRGFVVNVYAGEGPALTQDERLREVSLHREITQSDQAQAYQRAGADALLICPPSSPAGMRSTAPMWPSPTIKPLSPRWIFPFSCSNCRLSIVDNVVYSHELLIQLAREIDSVAGVKMAQANDALRYDRDYLALQSLGRPMIALPSVASSLFHNLTTGAEGILTGLATFAPHEMVALWRAVHAGDYARGIFTCALPLLTILFMAIPMSICIHAIKRSPIWPAPSPRPMFSARRSG